MTITGENIARDIIAMLGELKQEIPESIESFSALSMSALKSGRLDKRIKELIALAISIMQKSSACMAFHLNSLIKQGFTYEELLEISAVVLYMGGGPGLMAAKEALDVYHTLSPSHKSDATKGYG